MRAAGARPCANRYGTYIPPAPASYRSAASGFNQGFALAMAANPALMSQRQQEQVYLLCMKARGYVEVPPPESR